MKRSVVVIPFPFSDLSGAKNRPALVIGDWNDTDVILCQITSRPKKDGFEVLIEASDFESGGLPVQSNIRPNKIFTAHKSNIVSTAGKISLSAYEKVVKQIIQLIS